MSELKNYPQLPSAIWWGFRDMLVAKPSIVVQPKTIAIQFDVQETAAKAYIRELQKIGMLDEENKPTPVALRWRMDDTYKAAVSEILSSVYPEDLREALDIEDIDRGKAKQWFQYDGLGSGAAGNKAATLAVIASPSPGETQKPAPTKSDTAPKPPKKKQRKDVAPSDGKSDDPPPPQASFPLNVNIQIHISADSTNEQIETIFQSMKKYLGKDVS